MISFTSFFNMNSKNRIKVVLLSCATCTTLVGLAFTVIHWNKFKDNLQSLKYLPFVQLVECKSCDTQFEDDVKVSCPNDEKSEALLLEEKLEVRSTEAVTDQKGITEGSSEVVAVDCTQEKLESSVENAEEVTLEDEDIQNDEDTDVKPGEMTPASDAAVVEAEGNRSLCQLIISPCNISEINP
jgi:hypothetical protein